ncbi:tRNA (adenosine(37)-N6)-threonylcarbamoyltransferase complex ATPase subunit type 1 TsaE [Candidatus Uhrbacteria bacterium]|nr:tRNA (adenosine(37)-N6)-threonylcarbamoyltransferase complex ATPase subunit type 1 TsaE [Candidatus Uhrbacteria bacterium]
MTPRLNDSTASFSPNQTKQIAEDFAKTLKGGEVIFLEGELGTGKTTFVQGAAKALGYGGPVRSPTFTIVNIYPASHETIKKIVHIDLYRIKNKSELSALALEELVQDPNSVMFIEWPSLLRPLLKTKPKRIIFEETNSVRKIEII